jgi:hypothetical protein
MIFHTPNEGVATTGPVGFLWMSSTSRLGMFYDVKNSRLGIGTTSPGSTLQVSGTSASISCGGVVGTSNVVQIGSPTTYYGTSSAYISTRFAILTSGLPVTNDAFNGNGGVYASGQGIRIQGQDLVWAGGAIRSYASYIEVDGGGSKNASINYGQIRFYTANNQRLTIDESGLVGIGTASPGYTLDVGSFGVDGGTIRIVSSSSCAFRMMEVNDTYGFSFTNVAASRMSIKRHSGLQAGTEIISILRDNSFVGIGITNPTKPLVVTRPGGAGNFPAIMVANNGNGSGFRISTYDMTADGQAYMGLGTDMGGNAYEHSLLFPYGSTGQGIQTVGWYNGTTYSTRAYIQTGSTNWVSVSDIRAKDIVRPISNVLPLLSNLSTIVYTLKDDIIKTSHLGLIAQEVALVFPEACDIPTDPEQRMGITYTELVPVLVEAVKELAAKNADLEARLAALEAK